MDDTIHEGTPCPVCHNTVKGWPYPNPILAAAIGAMEKMSKLVRALDVEDDASFAYAFKLGGLRREPNDRDDYGAYWPESQDGDYYTITSLAEQIAEVMGRIAKASSAVEVAIAVDNEGQYSAKTIRFPFGVDEAEGLRMLAPRKED